MRRFSIAFASFAMLVTLSVPVTAQDLDFGDRPEDTEIWEPVPHLVAPSAPVLSVPAPSDALVLFDGNSLDEWVNIRDGTPAGWLVAEGVLTVNKRAGHIVTRRSFQDYQIHIEWRIPLDINGEGQNRGNSGLYLAVTEKGTEVQIATPAGYELPYMTAEGYELQILDSFENPTYVNGMAGSIYKQSIPLVNASRRPGEWQTYDVVWRAPRFNAQGSLLSPARVTVMYNGVLVQDGFELSGETRYTGAPAYRPHSRAPIMLQAHPDPSPPISFRNIWVRELS